MNSAGEINGQHTRIKCRPDPAQFGFRRTAFSPGATQARPDVINQLRADSPQMARIDLLQS